MSPGIFIVLMIMGWLLAALALLWAMLRIAHHHHHPDRSPSHPQRQRKTKHVSATPHG